MLEKLAWIVTIITIIIVGIAFLKGLRLDANNDEMLIPKILFPIGTAIIAIGIIKILGDMRISRMREVTTYFDPKDEVDHRKILKQYLYIALVFLIIMLTITMYIIFKK